MTANNVLMSQQWLDAMYYVYYVINISGFSLYCYVLRNSGQWDRVRHQRYIHWVIGAMVLNALTFIYWFAVLLKQASDTTTLVHTTTISVPLFALSCALHFIFSGGAIMPPVATDSQTFEYMERTYGCVPGELQRRLSDWGMKRFPVDAFEEWLADQNTAAGPAPTQSVKHYLAERQVAFNAAVTWKNNAQCIRDYDELCALRMDYCDNEQLCSWDKIRAMRVRAEG
jgi:hypothetical protein